MLLLRKFNLAETYAAMVHAYPHPSDLHDCEGYDSLLAKRKGKGERVLDAGAKLITDAGFPVERDLLEGPAADALISVAQTRKADLIIMGTRGMGAVKG